MGECIRREALQKETRMTTPDDLEVSGGITEDQAASAMLKRWAETDDKEQSPEPEDEEESTDEQPQGDAESEDESDDEGSESDEIEIDVGGEKFKLPPAQAEQAKRIEAKVKEIEAGTTRKFQEASELRKVAETQIQSAQQLQKIAHEQSDLIADHKMVERRLAALERIDINALADSDPVALTKINAEYNQLISAKGRIEAQYQQSVQTSQQEFTKQHQAKVVQLNEYAKRNIKGWSDDYSNKLMEFSVNTLGFSPDALRNGINEPLIKAIDLAYQGHKVRTADPKAKQILQTKTLKPGSTAQSKSNASALAEKSRARLAKSGSTEDAAMALLYRSGSKKR